MHSTKPRHDASAWPIAVLTPSSRRTESGMADIEDLKADVAWLRGLLKRQARCTVILDLRAAPLPDARSRRLYADLLRDESAAIARWCAGFAIVEDSALTRGATTAVFWLAKPPVPWEIVSSLEEAQFWCRATLESR